MSDPAWLPALPHGPQTPAALMRLALDVALASARNGGGPFGALVADEEGRVIDVGWNRVIAEMDSTAHAEVTAIRRAQARLGAYRLDGATLYTSCAPCIQCFGAVYWSGLARVVACARKEDAEALGFEEGPMHPDLWERARREKGIVYEADFLRDERALEPLREYVRRGGVIYSRGKPQKDRHA